MTDTDHGPGLFSPHSRIVILERPGCHLCDEALAVVTRVANEHGESITRRNIDDDDALARRWSIEIPVIAVDGSVIAVHRITETQLRRALTPSRSGRLARVLAPRRTRTRP